MQVCFVESYGLLAYDWSFCLLLTVFFCLFCAGCPHVPAQCFHFILLFHGFSLVLCRCRLGWLHQPSGTSSCSYRTFFYFKMDYLLILYVAHILALCLAPLCVFLFSSVTFSLAFNILTPRPVPFTYLSRSGFTVFHRACLRLLFLRSFCTSCTLLVYVTYCSLWDFLPSEDMFSFRLPCCWLV